MLHKNHSKSSNFSIFIGKKIENQKIYKQLWEKDFFTFQKQLMNL